MFFISDIIDEDNVIVSRNHAGADAVPISISELYECTGFIPVTGMHDNIIFCMKERVFAYQDRITAHFYGKEELSYIGGDRYMADNCFLLDKLQVIKWGQQDCTARLCEIHKW